MKPLAKGAIYIVLSIVFLAVAVLSHSMRQYSRLDGLTPQPYDDEKDHFHAYTADEMREKGYAPGAHPGAQPTPEQEIAIRRSLFLRGQTCVGIFTNAFDRSVVYPVYFWPSAAGCQVDDAWRRLEVTTSAAEYTNAVLVRIVE